jgi:uncharacterized protein YabE (DUF348 family)
LREGEAKSDSATLWRGVRNLTQSALHWRWVRRLWSLLLAAALGGGLIQGYLATRIPVIIYDGDNRIAWHTHQASVGAALGEAGIELGPKDIVAPGLANPLRNGDVIRVRRAQQATVIADGAAQYLETHADSVRDLLRQADLQLGDEDWLTLNGRQATPDTPLYSVGDAPRSVSSRGQERSASPASVNAPLELAVHRAVPFSVNDDGLQRRMRTTHATVGEALLAEGITLHLGDEVVPPLDTPLRPDLEILIRRSRPVEITADGQHLRTRTRSATVGQVLSQEGITLMGRDYTAPAEGAAPPEAQPIRVVRVQRAFQVEQQPIPYETVWVPDNELDLDHQQLQQAGEEGIHRWRYNLIIENGRPVSRNLEEEWLAREPTNKAIAYGTKITIRELETPQGTLQYWRRIPMLATSYSAATCGKPPDHPLYGITRLGWKMRKGIVAVDPAVIKLGTQVYVPDYGVGDVGDTGGAIRGRHIDLGYDEDNLVYWYRWMDIYLLAPIPPADEIRYVLPNWPQRP